MIRSSSSLIALAEVSLFWALASPPVELDLILLRAFDLPFSTGLGLRRSIVHPKLGPLVSHRPSASLLLLGRSRALDELNPAQQ